MTSTFAGGTCYTQSAEVLSFLQIANPTQADIDVLDNTLIPISCDYIDRLAGTTWGSIEVTDVLSIGRYVVSSLYLIGAPIYLHYYPVIPFLPGVQTFLSFKVYNGNNYQEFAGVQQEARMGVYWCSAQEGIAYLNGWYWSAGYEIECTYAYGYNTTGTPYLDGRVHELAIRKAAQMFLESNRYNAEISEGIGGVSMQEQYKNLTERIQQLERMLAGYKSIGGGFIS